MSYVLSWDVLYVHHMSGFWARYTIWAQNVDIQSVPLHPFQPRQARFLCRDSDKFCNSKVIDCSKLRLTAKNSLLQADVHFEAHNLHWAYMLTHILQLITHIWEQITHI